MLSPVVGGPQTVSAWSANGTALNRRIGLRINSTQRTAKTLIRERRTVAFIGEIIAKRGDFPAASN